MTSARPRTLFVALDIVAQRHTLLFQSSPLLSRCQSRRAVRQFSPLVLRRRDVGGKRIQAKLGIRSLSVTEAVVLSNVRHLSTLKQKEGVTPATSSAPNSPLPKTPLPAQEKMVDKYESPYTIPNALTCARILACPILGYEIIQGNYGWATSILFVSGLSDWLDGWLARRYNSYSVLGSILDPAADKILMATLVGTLAWSGSLPLPLALLIIGRDIGLSISAFYFRFISLPKPRSLQRYFDPSIPSAQVTPTQISKINTLLQLLLMGLTTVAPILPFTVAMPLQALQWTVAGTTIWSGLSYVGRTGVKILK